MDTLEYECLQLCKGFIFMQLRSRESNTAEVNVTDERPLDGSSRFTANMQEVETLKVLSD